MNVHELKKILQDVPDDTEVKLAEQPAWPFEFNVGQVVVTELDLEVLFRPEDRSWWVVDNNCDPQDEEYWVSDPYDTSDKAEARRVEMLEEFTPTVYIVEGTEQEYLRGNARAAVGW